MRVTSSAAALLPVKSALIEEPFHFFFKKVPSWNSTAGGALQRSPTQMRFWLMAACPQSCKSAQMRNWVVSKITESWIGVSLLFFKIKDLLFMCLLGEKNWTLKNVTEEWSVMAGRSCGATFKPNLITLLSQKQLWRKQTLITKTSLSAWHRVCRLFQTSTCLLEQPLLIKPTKGMH